MTQLPIGEQAPDFELKDTAGRTRRLSEALAGGPVVLAFYKSSCPTCHFTFPYLEKIAARAGPTRGWTLWGISQDEPEETQAFAGQCGLSFDLLIDEHPYPVSAAYGLEFVPAFFLVETDGTIALSDFGFTKAGLNQIAGYEFFAPDDGLPPRRPGCRARN